MEDGCTRGGGAGLDIRSIRPLASRVEEQVPDTASAVRVDAVSVTHQDHYALGKPLGPETPRGIDQNVPRHCKQDAIGCSLQLLGSYPRWRRMGHQNDLVDDGRLVHFDTFTVLPVLLGSRWTDADGVAVGLPAGLVCTKPLAVVWWLVAFVVFIGRFLWLVACGLFVIGLFYEQLI